MDSKDGTLYFQPRLDLGQLNSDVARMKQMISGVSQRAAHESNLINKTMTNIVKLGGAYFTMRGAEQFVSQIVSIRGQFQQLEVAFETMLQSKVKANAMMSEVVDFAAKTPFQLTEVASGTKQLLAYRIEQEKIIPTLKALGDVSAGLSVPIGRLILNYGQVKTAAKLTGRELRDFNMAGVPLIAELSKNLGKTETEIQSMVSAGKIGFKEVEEAFKTMTSEGGRFADLMDKQSGTITGRISNLKDNIDKMMNDIGEANEGAINDAISGVGYLVENYEKVGSIISELIIIYGSYRAALMVTSVAQRVSAEMAVQQALAQGTLTTSQKIGAVATVNLQRVTKMLNATMLANPYVWVGAAVMGLVYAIVKLATAESSAEMATKSFNEHLKKQKELAEKERQELEETINIIKDEVSTRTEKQLALEKLQSKYPSIFQNMDIEAVKQSKINKLLKLGNQEREKRVKLSTEDLVSRTEKVLNSRPQLKGFATDEYREQYDKWKEEVRAIAKEMDIDEGFWNSFADTKGAVELSLKKIKSNLKQKESAKLQSEFNAQEPEQKKAFYEEQNKKLKQELEEKKKALADAKKSSLPTSFISADIISIEKQIKANERLITTYNKEKEAYTNASKVKANALKKIAQARAEIKRLQGVKMDSSKRAELIAKENEKIKEQQELIKKQGYQLGGQKKEAPKEQKDYTADLQRIAIEKARTKKDLEFQVSDAEINAMQDGLKKKLAQNELNYRKEIEQLKRQREDRLKQINEQERIEWEAKHPKHKEQKLKFVSRIALPEQEDANFTKLEGNAGIRFKTSNEKAYADELNAQADFVQAYLEKAQELEEKKKLLKEQGYSDRQIAEVSRIEQESLDVLNEQMGISEEFVTTIANDLIEMGLNSVIEKLHEAEEVLKAEEQKGGADKAKIKVLKQKIKALKVALKSKTKEQSKAPDTGDWEKTVDILIKVNSTAQQAISGFDGLSESGKKTLGVLFSVSSGAVNIIQTIKSVTENAIGGTMAAAKAGKAAVSSVEKASVILAIISIALQVVQKIFSLISGSNKAHKEALEKIRKAQLATQREYNKLLFKQKMLMKDSENIFGVDAIGKGIKYLALYNQKFKELQDKIAVKKEWENFSFAKAIKGKDPFFSTWETELERIRVKTGHKKTGLFGWGKGRDIYDSILKVYPDLINADGTFNKQRAEASLKNQQFADEHKEKLEEIIQKYDEMTEAQKAFDNYLKDTFGEMGRGMMDSVVQALKSGEDSFERFGKSVGEVMQKLGQQAIFNTVLKPFFDDLQENIKKIYNENGDNIGAITSKVGSLISGSMGQLRSRYKASVEFGKKLREELKGEGIDVWEEDERREASKKGFEAITQDQAGKLDGQFTLMTELKRQSLDTVKGIAADIKYLQSNSAKQLEYLSNIDTNTARLEKIETGIGVTNSTLDDIKTHGIKIK